MNSLPTIHFELLDTPEGIMEQIDQINAFRRYIFNNAYEDFLVYPETGKAISPQKFFRVDSHQYVPIHIMDEVKEEHLPEGAIIYRHPDKMKKLLIDQLVKEEGHVLLAKSSEEIVGMTYGYRAKLKRIFELEWSNKYLYSKDSPAKFDRSFGEFMKNIDEATSELNLNEDSELYCWNCLGARPELKGVAKAILKKYFSHLKSQEWDQDTLLINDIIRDSKLDKVMSIGESASINGFIGKKRIKNEEIIKIARLADIAKYYTAS